MGGCMFQHLFAWNFWTLQCPTPWIAAFRPESSVAENNSWVNLWEPANWPLQLWNCAMQFQRAARAVRPLGAALSLNAICWAPNYRQEGLVGNSGKLWKKSDVKLKACEIYLFVFEMYLHDLERIWNVSEMFLKNISHVSQYPATLHLSMPWPVTSHCCRPVGEFDASWKGANGPWSL